MKPGGALPEFYPQGAAFLRAVLDSLPAEICVLDTDGKIIAVNAHWIEHGVSNGAERSAIDIGANYLAGMGTSEDRADAAIAYDATVGVRAVLAGERDQYQLEYPCHGPRQQNWYLMTATGLRLGEPSTDVIDEAPDGAVITHLDITSRILTERETQRLLEAMREQERRLDALMRDVPASVWEAVATPGGETITWTYGSAFTKNMTGFPVADWLGKPNFFYERVAPDDRDRIRQRMKTFCERGEGGILSFGWITRDARRIDVESVTNITREEDGQCRLRCVTTDVTRRHQVQMTLRNRAKLLMAAARDLRRSNAELDQFAYVASHDLRAPLRGIRQLAQFIAEDFGDEIEEEVSSKLDLMQDRIGRMERLIGGLLAYSQLGRTVDETQQVDVRGLVEDVVEMLEPPAAVTVHIDVPHGAHKLDGLKLQQVIQNLVANAINHHDRLPDGPANVWITWRDRGDAWDLEVRDDGPGIDPKYHAKIFEMFQTLGYESRGGSTGVGLSIVHKIMSQLNSDVQVRSTGRGTSFLCRWPKRAPRNLSALNLRS